jgi:hypothetical protein
VPKDLKGDFTVEFEYKPDPFDVTLQKTTFKLD